MRMTEGGAPFRVDVVEMPNGALVKADGDIDLSTVPTLIEEVGGLVHGPPATLTIDMSGVGFCDSAGINGLVKLRNGCFDAGWQFKIINLQGHLRHVIVDLTGLGEFLGVEPG